MSAALAVAPRATPASMPRAIFFKIMNFSPWGFLIGGVSRGECAHHIFHADDETNAARRCDRIHRLTNPEKVPDDRFVTISMMWGRLTAREYWLLVKAKPRFPTTGESIALRDQIEI